MSVVGARPNFLKIDPIVRFIAELPIEFGHFLVHTGQHYDTCMSQVFFDELNLPKPDINLETGTGSHATQTARIMERFEPVLLNYKPDWLIVPGDVNSTLACALVASKLGTRIAHLEAGLRSFDRSMPEEINRVLTDQLSDLLLIPSLDARENLLREGIAEEKIHFVGNAMIDTLVRLLPKAQSRLSHLKSTLSLKETYVLCTLHRPGNVDTPNTLSEIMAALEALAEESDVLFPVHPRTRDRLNHVGLLSDSTKLKILDPLGYLDFLALQKNAGLVITDSGGVQEETTFLGVPCITIRPNTERPITIKIGTNTLVDAKRNAIEQLANEKLSQPRNTHQIPELWDGRTGERIADLFKELD